MLPDAKFPEPIELTEEELDAVAGGALVNVIVNNAVNHNNIGVAAQALTANSGQTFTQTQ